MREICPAIHRKYHVAKEGQEERKKQELTVELGGGKTKTTLKSELAFRIALISLATVIQCHSPVTIHICEQSAVLHALAINIYIN